MLGSADTRQQRDTAATAASENGAPSNFHETATTAMHVCLWCVPGLLCAQAVREGSWWARAETDSQFCELEGVASLQQLAASVMGEEEVQDPTALDTPAESPAAAAPTAAAQQKQSEAQVRTGRILVPGVCLWLRRSELPGGRQL
jgi:hypothetical protein